MPRAGSRDRACESTSTPTGARVSSALPRRRTAERENKSVFVLDTHTHLACWWLGCDEAAEAAPHPSVRSLALVFRRGGVIKVLALKTVFTFPSFTEKHFSATTDHIKAKVNAGQFL